MARVKTPLLSLDAAGKVGQHLYFSGHGNRHYAKRLTPASGLPTDAQTLHRSVVAACISAWRGRAFTSLDLEVWLQYLTRQPRLWTLYNAFLHLTLATTTPYFNWFDLHLTGRDVLVGGELSLYVAQNFHTTNSYLHWGFTPSCEQEPIIMTPAAWHGDDLNGNTGVDGRGRRIWYFCSWDGNYQGYGQSPPAYIDIPA